MEVCLLCNSNQTTLYYQHNRRFHKCETCGCVFIPKSQLPKSTDEKNRYLAHQNNIEDLGFQKFVSPILNAVLKDHTKDAKGLDFGAGTGPVITKLLVEKGYKLALYDPFFHPDRNVLDTTYNFIVCCEVIEHLHTPLKEFKLLKTLLQENGTLYCMTDLLPKKEAFANWYYKNDFTHVIFYTQKSLQWIKETVGFNHVSIEGRLIVFS